MTLCTVRYINSEVQYSIMIKINKSIDKNQVIRSVITCMFLSVMCMLLTTYIHEGLHWIMAMIDPGCNPLEYHIFDIQSFSRGAAGYVLLDSSPAILNLWIQEVICYGVQLIITLLVLKVYIKRRC